MDPALKQRLIGATVLVALGVIFIPMLLERSSDEAGLSVQMEIPPQPEVNIPAELQEPVAVKPIDPPSAMPESIDDIKRESSKGGQQQPGKATASKPLAKSKIKVASDRVTKPSKVEVDKWVVQVGSFSKQANAQVLRDKLNADGFNARVETAKAKTGPVYRVRLGPFKQRSLAEYLVDKLDKKGGYRAMVMADLPDEL